MSKTGIAEMGARIAGAKGRREPDNTRAALVKAARKEFEGAGFDATNSNKIAARAGFAPQTFYRHFEDKTAIFLAVYEQWVADELKALDGVDSARGGAKILVRHHRGSLKFRRALRQLSVSDPRVRASRAKSRLAQIEALRCRLPRLNKVPLARLARALTTIERVADACAEGEYVDLGFSPQAAEDQLAECLRQELVLLCHKNPNCVRQQIL